MKTIIAEVRHCKFSELHDGDVFRHMPDGNYVSADQHMVKVGYGKQMSYSSYREFIGNISEGFYLDAAEHAHSYVEGVNRDAPVEFIGQVRIMQEPAPAAEPTKEILPF